LTENRSSALAASKATQPPELATIVCDGRIHARAADPTPGTNAKAAASASTWTLGNDGFMVFFLTD
jgi:hypothetical protein